MRLLVVGAGSTGGYFGGRLAAAGRDVTFLVRTERAAHLRADGLRIVSPYGDLMMNPKLITPNDNMTPFDAVLLAVKAYSLNAALDDCAPGVGPATMILPVLNGMRHVDTLQDRFGANALIGCVCKIASVVDDQGRIVQLTGLHDLAYGEMNGEESTRTQQLNAFMQGAGFDATLSHTIEREMWEKWVMLATIGAINCLMRGTVGEVEGAHGGTGVALKLLEEVVTTVTALGHPPRQEFVRTMKDLLSARGSTTTSSMYRDLQSGRRLEADQIIGDLLARARSTDLETPLPAAAYAHLCVYQNRLDPAI